MNLATLSHADIALAVAFIVSFGAAHATQFLVKAAAPKWLISLVVGVLGALAGVIPTVTWAENTSWVEYVRNIFLAVITTYIIHDSGVADWVGKVSANFGIGRSIYKTNTTMVQPAVPGSVTGIEFAPEPVTTPATAPAAPTTAATPVAEPPTASA